MRTITITIPSVPSMLSVRKGIKHWWNVRVSEFAQYLLDHTHVEDDLSTMERTINDLDNSKLSSSELDNFRDEFERSFIVEAESVHGLEDEIEKVVKTIIGDGVDADDVKGLEEYFSSSIEHALSDDDSDACKSMKELVSELVSLELARRESESHPRPSL